MSNSSTVIRRLYPDSSRKKNKFFKTLIVLGLNFLMVFFTAWYLKENQKPNRSSQSAALSAPQHNQKVSQPSIEPAASYASELQVDIDTLFKE